MDWQSRYVSSLESLVDDGGHLVKLYDLQADWAIMWLMMGNFRIVHTTTSDGDVTCCHTRWNFFIMLQLSCYWSPDGVALRDAICRASK